MFSITSTDNIQRFLKRVDQNNILSPTDIAAKCF